MKEELLKRIDNIAKNLMSEYSYKDFQRYERTDLYSMKETDSPFIVQFGENHCMLIKPKHLAESFKKYENIRYGYAQNGLLGFYSFSFSCLNDHFFLVTDDDIREITIEQAKEAVRDLANPIIEEWKATHEPLPTRFKVKVTFNGQPLKEIKELLYKDAKEGGSLLKCLKRFHSYQQLAKDHEVRLWYNKGWNEFSFGIYTNNQCGVTGGIVYHGSPETGYLQNGSVQIEPSYGWQIHT